MPNKPLRPCNHHACNQLTRNKYCEQHKADARQWDTNRPDYHRWYSSSPWRALRRSVLSASPLCVHCAEQNITTIATEVDHIIEHKGNRELFYKHSNLQTLCKSCHSKKTATESGWGKLRSWNKLDV